MPLSLDMWELPAKRWLNCADNPRLRVDDPVGAGDKAFVSGADISPIEKPATMAGQPRKNIPDQTLSPARAAATTPKPTIACIACFFSAAACRSPFDDIRSP